MPTNIALRRSVAEELLGDVDWDLEHAGTCCCPGAHRHTTKGDSARVFVDGCPTIACFHQSCAVQVVAANQDLRQRIREAELDPEVPYVPSEADRQRWQQRKRDQRLEMRARADLPRIVAQYGLDPEEWLERSPIPVGHDVENHWRHLLGVLPPWQRVWIGSLTDTGQPWHQRHFRVAREWLEHAGRCPGPYICPANFALGAYRRCDESVVFRQFIVVESDTLSKRETGAIFRWMMPRWHLFAIVDTGNKSIHGWFEMPDGLTYEENRQFKVVMKGMGCDPAMFRSSQPCRLPGWRREETGRWQRLLYLDALRPSRAPAATTTPNPE